MAADRSRRSILAEQVMARLASSLERIPEVECAYLFGSAARGDAGPLSDVDIAILPADRLSPAERAAWHARLIEQLERDVTVPVDVVLLDDASPRSHTGCYGTAFCCWRVTSDGAWHSKSARRASISTSDRSSRDTIGRFSRVHVRVGLALDEQVIAARLAALEEYLR